MNLTEPLAIRAARSTTLLGMLMTALAVAHFYAPATHAISRTFSSSAQPSALAPVHVLFDSATLNGPFPSDWFTVPDSDQQTGRRIALPTPSDCVSNRSECEDVALLNLLDGFNQHPRLSIPFTAPIDPNSATSQSILVISLGSTLKDEVIRSERWSGSTRLSGMR